MYNQRDIVLIPIPFTDLSSKKKRPVVVISNNSYNANSSDFVVAALTSNLSFENEYTLVIDNEHIEGGKLPKRSIIRCDKVYSLSQSIVVKKFDQLNASTFKVVQDKVRLLINNSM